MMILKNDILWSARTLTSAFLALSLFSACSSDVQEEGGGGVSTDLPIVLQGSISTIEGTGMRSTEAGTTHAVTQGDNHVLAAGSHVDLFLEEEGSGTTYTGQKFYLQTTAPSGSGDLGIGNFSFYGEQERTNLITRYWPPSGNGLYFFAYYPAGAIAAPVTHETTATQTFTVSVAQGATDGSQAYDLMFGIPSANPIGTAATNPVARPTALTREASAVNLNFKHCLSKVVVVLKGDGYGIGNGTAGGPATGSNAHKNGYDQYGRDQFTDATITLGSTDDMYLQASVIPSTGVATALTTGTTGEYTLKSTTATSTDHEYYCILPPQLLTGRKINLTLKDGGKKSFTIPQVDTDEDGTPDSNLTTVGGKSYIYTITVGLYSISVTATVGDWDAENVTGGTLKY